MNSIGKRHLPAVEVITEDPALDDVDLTKEEMAAS
jgi:hypothetical protein